ncbi:HK97 family phage portal protein [Hephaestia caeni]|uniref:HK97 family phage portal protein n=1 Tax=Hephaestia caeni TaxID=645617 RepID=A0A397NWT0_9SPHN|nr:phage portal protein [Hephaestia caeni]RIA37861.1 HK97 family phage portal protein [Hephaestia caeni]
MKIFGWKSAGRAEARPALSRSGTALITLGDWPRSYEAMVREAYCDNAVAQRAVRMVSESVAAAPVTASEPALARLIAERSGGQPLTETIAAHLLLHGNAYVQVLVDGAGGIAELFALRPERVSVEADAGGWPAAYRYRVGDRVTRLTADAPRPEVIHLKTFHPSDDHYGLGCLGAAAGAVAIHNAATRWAKALLDNAARPSGALVYDPGDGSSLSADQFKRLREEMEAGFAGAGNAGRPMLLEGGLKWQALSLSPADMDFAGTKAAAAREIALAFGVPPMLLGLPGDNTYANYKEANRALWRLAVLPLAQTILGGIAEALGGWFAGAALAVDLDSVPALSEDRERLWARVSAADFLTPDEKRAMLGIDR